MDRLREVVSSWCWKKRTNEALVMCLFEQTVMVKKNGENIANHPNLVSLRQHGWHKKKGKAAMWLNSAPWRWLGKSSIKTIGERG